MEKINAQLVSFAYRMGEEEEMTAKELEFLKDKYVDYCLMHTYKKLIRMLYNGKSYKDIYGYISGLSSEDFASLTESQKIYVKAKLRHDTQIRENKIKERMKNE